MFLSLMWDGQSNAVCTFSVCVCVCVYVCVHVHAGVMYSITCAGGIHVYICAPLVWLHVHVCLMQCTCMCTVPDEDSP